MKWANRVALTSVDVPDDNYNNMLGVDKDKEKAFEDNHNELIKYISVGVGIGGEIFQYSRALSYEVP